MTQPLPVKKLLTAQPLTVKKSLTDFENRRQHLKPSKKVNFFLQVKNKEIHPFKKNPLCFRF